jgi:hypothetical protein
VIGAWLADRDRADQHQRRREVAVDAKTLRGARQDGRRIPDRGGPRHPRRIELRTLKAVSVGGFGFPHTAQVVQVSRKVRDRRSPGRRWRTMVVYAVTSLPHAQTSPGRLADLIRGHWVIENGLHDAREVTFAEGGLPGPDRVRPAGHGLPAQPGDRRAWYSTRTSIAGR